MTDPTATVTLPCPHCGTDISEAAAIRKAVAARNAEIAEAVRRLEGQCHDGEGLGCDSFPCSVNVSRSEVLAIIEAAPKP
jgi:hypothetical protein